MPSFVKSIKFKFGLVLVLLLFLVFTIFAGFLIYRNINAQNKYLTSQARAFAQLSVQPIGDTYSLYYDSGYNKFTQLMDQILSLDKDIIEAQIISPNGEVLYDTVDLSGEKPSKLKNENNQEVLKKIQANEASEIPSKTEESKPKQIIQPYFEDWGAHPFSIRYFVSYDSVTKNIAATIFASALLSAAFLAGAVVLIFFVIGRTIISPMGSVIEGARLIKSGDFSHNIEVKNKDEIGDLAAAVNQMAQTLKRNIVELKELDKLKDEFVFLASHNLRTPITIIRGFLEYLQENKSLDSGAKDKLAKIEAGTKELEALAESLLNIVALENREKSLYIEKVDLGDLVEKIAEDYGKEAAQKKVSFIFETPSKPLSEIEVDKIRMKQALGNIIGNAVKFNREGGKVIIKLEEKDGQLLLSIQDNGIGIPKEEEKHIFEKFHRATGVLTYNYEGIGLGLYSTRLIIEAHRGKIWVEATPGEGTIFYVTLPITVKYLKD